ncbi:MAG: hypothetical protein ABUK01_15575 [Leptospirales bacterium]
MKNKSTTSPPNAFTTDGLLFPAEDLISIPDLISGSIDANGKIRLSAEDITLNAGGLSLTGASALLTNDKIEMIGQWLGLSLALRAQIEENSFSLVGDTSFETGINTIQKMALPATPVTSEIDLGEIHIESAIGVDVQIGMSLDTLSVKLNVAFSCLGDHSISFEVDKLPDTIEGFANLIREQVTDWVSDNVLPDTFIPKDGELLPANDFVSVTGKLAGNLTPEGKIYLSASNVSLSALRGTFTVGEADALLTNDTIDVSGKWLNTLDIALAIEVTQGHITLIGDTQIEISTFDIDLTFSKLPDPLAKMMANLTREITCSGSGDIHVEIDNADLSIGIDLKIICMGNHSLPTFSISASPSSLTDLITTIKNEINNWVLDKLSPDTFLLLGAFKFPSSLPVKLTGTLAGYFDKSGDFSIGIMDAGFTIGSFNFGTVTLTFENRKVEFIGSFLAVKLTVNLLQEDNQLILKGDCATKTINFGVNLGALSFPIPVINYNLNIGPLSINIGSLDVALGFVLRLTSFSFTIACTIVFFGLTKSISFTLSVAPLNLAALVTAIGTEIAKHAWNWIKEVMGTNPFTVVIAIVNKVNNPLISIQLKGSKIDNLNLNNAFESMMTMDLNIKIAGVQFLSGSLKKEGSGYRLNGTIGFSTNLIGLTGTVSGYVDSSGNIELTGTNNLTFNGTTLLSVSTTLTNTSLTFSASFMGENRTLRFDANAKTISMDDFDLSTSISNIPIPTVKKGGAPGGFGPIFTTLNDGVTLPSARVSFTIGGTFYLKISSSFTVPNFNLSASVTLIIASPGSIQDIFTQMPTLLANKVAENIQGLCSFPRINFDYSWNSPHADRYIDTRWYGDHSLNVASYHVDAPHVDGNLF